MKKKVVKFGANTAGISFDQHDKDYYNIHIGDYVIFNIEKIIRKNGEKYIVKYDKKKVESL